MNKYIIYFKKDDINQLMWIFFLGKLTYRKMSRHDSMLECFTLPHPCISILVA